MKYQCEVIKIVNDILSPLTPIKDSELEVNLQDIGMNSIDFIRIVVEIENYFDIDFPDEKLLITEAGTIKNLCRIIVDIKDLDVL